MPCFVSQTQLPCYQLHVSHGKQDEHYIVTKRLARRHENLG